MDKLRVPAQERFCRSRVFQTGLQDCDLRVGPEPTADQGSSGKQAAADDANVSNVRQMREEFPESSFMALDDESLQERRFQNEAFE